MNAVDFFLGRYREFHRGMFDDLTKGLTEAQVRGRPRPGVNPIAWLLWHTVRIEDVGVNRFITDGRQVLDTGSWLGRMKLARRDVGTGMVDAEVDELGAQIDLEGLRGYWEAVQTATLAIVETLRNENLETVVPADRVQGPVGSPEPLRYACGAVAAQVRCEYDNQSRNPRTHRFGTLCAYDDPQ